MKQPSKTYLEMARIIASYEDLRKMNELIHSEMVERILFETANFHVEQKTPKITTLERWF